MTIHTKVGISLALVMMAVGCSQPPAQVSKENTQTPDISVTNTNVYSNIFFVNMEFSAQPYIETNKNTSAWYMQHCKIGSY